jgi:Lon protease-like protein
MSRDSGNSCFQLDIFPELTQDFKAIHDACDDMIAKINKYREIILSYESDLLKARGNSLEASLGAVTVRTKLALAQLELARQIKSLPASMSEHRAIFGEDPEIIAKRALRDAEKCADIMLPYLALVKEIQGHCLAVTNESGLARTAFEESLQYKDQKDLESFVEINYPSVPIYEEEEEQQEEQGDQSCRKCNKVFSARENPTRDDDMDCMICLKLLYHPVTTPCGHTFCRPCFQRTLDTHSKCPMCRRVFYGGFDLPVNIVLKNILERSFPDEYEIRKEEEKASITAQEGAVEQLPLFVLSPVLPGETVNLNVFEPRYRLMIRRVMEGNKKFGIIAMRGNNTLSPVGCEVDIVQIEAIPDGRYVIEVKGVRRFAIDDVDQVDGYRVAIRPQFFSDDEPTSEDRETVEQLVEHVDTLVQRWLEKLSENQAASLMLQATGAYPGTRDIEKFSFWAATSILVFMHARERKQRMIELKCTRERLEATKELFEAADELSSGGQAGRCLVM